MESKQNQIYEMTRFSNLTNEPLLTLNACLKKLVIFTGRNTQVHFSFAMFLNGFKKKIKKLRM